MLEYDVKDSKLDQRNERARTQGWRGEGGGEGGGGGISRQELYIPYASS